MGIKVGGKEIVNFSSFFIPENEEALVEYLHNDDIQSYKIKIKVDEKGKKNKNGILLPVIEYKGDENKLDIIFINWGNGTSGNVSTPFNVGVTEKGEEIYLIVFVKKLNAIYKVEIQTMVETNNAAK